MTIELTERQNIIVGLLQKKPSLGVKDMARMTGIAYRTLQSELSALQKKNVISREEGKKQGAWTINV